MNNIFENKVCSIFCGGFEPKDLPDFSPDDNLLIAADVGFDACIKNDIAVDVLIGDFDSVSCENLDNAKCEIIRLPTDKDDTDTLAAVKLGLKRGYKQFQLFGGLGCDFAHSLANVQVLNFLDEHGAKGVLVAGSTLVFLLTKAFSCLEIDLNMQKYFSPSQKVSLLSLTEQVCGIYTENLKWQLNNQALTWSFPLGASNKIISNNQNCAKISINAGKLLVVCGENLLYSF
ncbi:MAG: thiamine diphosphokinase [Coriobacteriales bacterium]|nr:thiamine diphosphokinase [Coriobacteriales bacterium]